MYVLLYVLLMGSVTGSRMHLGSYVPETGDRSALSLTIYLLLRGLLVRGLVGKIDHVRTTATAKTHLI